MVRETRYLIVRNLPDNCTEETVIDHFQRYGKIQSVKLQAAKDNDQGNTATVAFNDIKSAAKAHHAKNNLGEVTLRTDYWEGSTSTPVLVNPPVPGSGNAVRSATYSSTTPSSLRPVSTFSAWGKGTSEEDGSSAQDKGDITGVSTPGVNAPAVASSALDKLSSTSFDLQRGRAREKFSKKIKFGQKFEKSGSFGRHGTTTSSRSLEAARSQSEAAAAAAAAAASTTSSSTASATNTAGSNNSGTTGLNPIIVSDSKDSGSSKDLKESSRESLSRSRPHSVASPSSRHSGVKKSNSHSRSVSRSRSRSRGSRSSSSRSYSSATSRSTSPHRSYSSSTTRPQSMVGASRLVNSEVKEAKKEENEGERRPLGICVSGLPIRSTDSSLRDGLYHEYKKHGKVTAVQICGEGESRCAVVSFRKPEDASKALEASQGKTFFGARIKVTSHEGVEVDDADRGSEVDSMDEYNIKSTRTLFVGNLEKETTTQDLIEKFKQFGEIIDVDIKRQGATTAFAFVQYVDIASVVSALRDMEGEHIGINKIKLGFGKSMPTCCVWLDNLPSDTNSRMLRNLLSRYGEITYCCVDRNRNKALVYYTSYEDAQHCVSDIKMRPHLMKKKLQVDFASRECQTDFLDRMEESGQLRASERPDESRAHKQFRQQRSFDYQDDGSPSSYAYSSRNTGTYSSRNGRSGSTSTSFRRSSRQYGDYPEENHSGSRRSSRRPEEFSQSGSYYSGKGSGDDYDTVLREYGHSQRERRDRDLSPRRSVDRRMDSQSRISSRDHSLDRYDDRSKDRTVEIFASRDASPNSEHNSYRSEHRYRSSRDEKYSSRDRYDDAKVDDKDYDHHGRLSRTASPFLHNHNSVHSHDSDFARHAGGSRSQSPATPIREDSSMYRMFYSDDYKRSAVMEDEYDPYLSSQKRRDSDDIIKSKPYAALSNKLGAEVAKTAEKSRKRTHEESGLSDTGKLDSKLLRKLEKSSSLSEKEKKKHLYKLEMKSRMLKGLDRASSPGSSGSHGDSENGSASEGDLHHLHQEKQQLLLKLQELQEEGMGTSEPDSPRSSAKVKSVAVKDALRLSGRGHEDRKRDDLSLKGDAQWRQGDKQRHLDTKRESRNHLTDEMSATREDKSLLDEKESYIGLSDSDQDSNFRRSKKRRVDSVRDNDSLKSKDYRRHSSVDVSEEEEVDRKSERSSLIRSSSSDRRAACDSRANSVSSKFYDDTTKAVDVPSCDNSEFFKDGLSDKDLSVIKQHRTSSKSNSYFPNKDWNTEIGGCETSPVGYFSPTVSEEHTQDSVTSNSLTEKSSKHLSPTWQHSPPASPTVKDNSDGEFGYFKDYNAPASLDIPEDCLSDDSLGEPPQAPGEPSWEERIRAIDEILNMTGPNKSADPSLLSSSLSNKDIANNNDNTALYSKFRIRKREGLEGGNGSLLSDKKPEPSVIMKQVLSKKSILDQDFKRLEQMNEKYDPSSEKGAGFQFLPTGKGELASPKLPDLKSDAGLMPVSSSYSSSSSSPSRPPLSHPVTTSSSMLQPTITTSIAGLASQTASVNTSVLTSSIVSAPCTSSSISVSSKSAAVRVSQTSAGESLDLSDKLSVCTNSRSVKHEVSLSSSSLLPSTSVLTSSSHNSSSSASKSSHMSVTLACSTAVTLSDHSFSSLQQSSKTAISSLSLPTSLLSKQIVLSSSSPSSSSTLISLSTTPATTHSSSSSSISLVTTKPQQCVSSISSSSSVSSLTTLSSSSLSITKSPSGAPVAAPFTQGPDKSQLTPTVGQEAPHLCSPSFTPENSRTLTNSRLPGSQSPRVTSGHDDQQETTNNTNKPELTVNVSDKSLSDKPDDDSLVKSGGVSKPDVVSPDIESPVSVKSETSSNASVPLSSLDNKVSSHLDEKSLLTPLTISTQSSSPRSSTSSIPSQKSPSCVKMECISPETCKDKHGMDLAHNKDFTASSEQNLKDRQKGEEKGDAPDVLGSKTIDLSPPVITQTILSVSNKDNSEKKEMLSPSDISNNGKGKTETSTSLSLTSDMDTGSVTSTPKPSVTSSTVATSSSSSMPTSASSRSAADRSEKKSAGKSTSHNHSKSTNSPAKSEPLFAPDVKVEQPMPKSSESKSDSKHQSKDLHKASSSGPNKSSTLGEKKVTKLPSKDGNDGKESGSSNKDADKAEKKSSDAGGKSSGHDTTSKGKETDKNKVKDKRDHSKDGEKNKQREKEDVKKKDEKKSSEKKEDKKASAVKEEKKVEKKDKEKQKDGNKTSQMKETKSENDVNKKDKKVKDKNGKDKEKEKKLFSAGLACITKNSTPDSRSDSRTGKNDTKEGKTAKNETNKETAGKPEREVIQKSETPVKSEQKTSGKHKQDTKGGSKTSWDAKSEAKDTSSASSLSSKKSTADAVRQKKDSEKEGSKTSSSKSGDKLQKQKQKEEEKQREKQKLKEERERQKEKEEKERKEREELEKQEKEKEEREKERKEREEKERKEKEEKERLKMEREEKERQKEKEKEEKEKKEKEEKERQKKEKEEKERQKQKEKEEREAQKEKEKEEKEKQKDKERKEKEKREKEKKEKERKEKEKKAKEEKLKKEKEEKAKKEKEEKAKKEKETKEKAKKDKADSEKKEKNDKDTDKEEKEKKKPAPKKPKRNELAALLDSNDMFQMTFTSMYDRVKTQRNREPEQQQKTEPASKSSFDKFKQNRKKKGKTKSSLYSYDSTSDNLSDDNLSDLSESESSQKAEPVKQAKQKKTKQIKKRPHVSSTSSSSCEEDDDALLRASKPKGKKTDKFSEIFSSDSEEDNFQPPSNKSMSSTKTKGKPVPKRRKTRDDSTDSMASRDEFVKPQAMSSVTEPDSLDDMDVSEEDTSKTAREKKKKTKSGKASDAEKRDSSVESVTRKPAKVERSSSVESRKSVKAEKEEAAKNSKSDMKKSSKTKTDCKSSLKEDVKPAVSEKVKGSESDSHKEKSESKKEAEAKKDSEKSSIKDKSVEEEKKKKKDEDGMVKKKKKKKYDPKEEEERVNSLITKVYDKHIDKDKDKKLKKKSKSNVLDSESEDIGLSETSVDLDKKTKDKDETESVKVKDKKSDKDKDDTKEKAVLEVSKKEHKNKDDKKDRNDKKEHEKKSESMKKEKEKSEADTDTQQKDDDGCSKPPKKKKKKKDHDKDVEKEKDKSTKSGKKSSEKKDSDKPQSAPDDETSEDNKSSSQVVDEFTSFWGHPKPILIPKRLKDSKKTDDDKSKHKDNKDDCKPDEKTDKSSESSTKVKEEPKDVKEEKKGHADDKQLDNSPGAVKTPDSAATPKVESDASDDFAVPISEAETTVITEIPQPASSESLSSNADSLIIQEEPVHVSSEVTVLPDETTIGSSVEINDDDDYPSLIIDEISETVSEKKKMTKKEKKLLKKQQEKERNDRMDEVIASVAMAVTSDDEDLLKRSPVSLLIDSASNDQELLLSDVINQELKYDSKMSNEPERKSSIVSDIVIPDKEEKRKQQEMGPFSSIHKDKKEMKPFFGPATKKEAEKKKDSQKSFGVLDEETKKRDEELLKSLAVLCDPNVDKPVVIEDNKPKKQTEEELKKKEEEEKKRAEEEKKKVEEEEKVKREKEEQAMREASDEAARAVESLLGLSGFEQESMDMDDDLPPLFIEPADKEPPVESISISPSKDKSDGVSIFSSSIPEKVTANLDDKLLEKKVDEKGDQGDSKMDPFDLFVTPIQTVTPGSVFTSPRRNSAGVTKDKTPEPITMSSPQRQMQSPQRAMQQSPQVQSPQRQMPSPQRQMQSPQRQMPSPQRMQSPQKPLQSPQHQMQSPQRPVQPQQVTMQSPQPMLQSPQRSPFFSKDSKMDRGFMSPNRDGPFPQTEMDIPPVQQPQRRASSGLPVPPVPEQAHDPVQVSGHRKSQEFPVEQAFHSSRSVPAPEDTAVAHLDRRFSHHQGPSVVYQKERTHGQLPPPVSISLDHAPHDKNFQSPMRSLTIPPHQENVLLSPKKVSPGLHFKDHNPEAPVFQSPPNKNSLQEQMFPSPRGPLQEQIFAHHPKGLNQEPMFHGGKGPMHDKFFKPTKGPAEQQVFLASKGPIPEKPMVHTAKGPEPLFPHQKGPQQEPVFPQSKGPQHLPEPISQHGKGMPLQQEPMFSPKAQSENNFNYQEQSIDFLLNSPPRNAPPGFINFPPNPEVSKPGASKSLNSHDAYSQDPLFIAVSEASARPPERQPPQPRRIEGFPASFYQEPVPSKPHQESSNLQQSQALDDDKKGTRKRKRTSKKATKEDVAAALAEQQAIEESVQAHVESIHKALNANQAKAAAEKAGTAGDKKKLVDAYDFDAHSGHEPGVIPGLPMSDAFGDGDSKPLRSRNDRGRGRVYSARRGRRGRGGMSSVHDSPIGMQRPEPVQHQQQPPHFSGHIQNQDHLPPHPQMHQYQQQQFPPPPQQQHHQQPLPPFQRQNSQTGLITPQMPSFYQQSQPSPMSSENSSSLPTPDWQSPQQQQQQKQPPQHFHHMQSQHQQHLLQQSSKFPPSKSDVLSPEPNKLDLDSSYGESELVINLDDQPPSIEGKENQYTLSSDGEDRGGLGSSPATPKSQRSTRARKPIDYNAIASGNAQAAIPPRTSRSGGSPRARGTGAQSPKNNMSPRTRSTENVPSSSPVVKLEKLEVARGTRARRDGGKSIGKDDNEEVSPTTSSVDDWKANKIGADDKPNSKEYIYEFDDNEQDQHIEPPVLRPTRSRKKRASDSLDSQQQQSVVDFMPGSPASSSNSSSLLPEPKPGFESSLPEARQMDDSSKASSLSNVDAVIDAVSKGIFGSSEDEASSDVPTPTTSDSTASMPHTRASRRSSEAKKESEQKEKTTFSIAEPPRFDGRETGRKGPTVPPLRIKVAHGTPKVEKNEEKHYVIARSKGSESEKPPLSFTVKLSDSGTATIKPAGGSSMPSTPTTQVMPQGVKGQIGDGMKPTEAGAQKKDTHLGIFSGLPQNDLSNDIDASKSSSSASQLPPWKSMDTTAEDVPITKTTGAMHPKVAAKAQASLDAQHSVPPVPALVQTSLSSQPPLSMPGHSKSSSVTSAAIHGPKHAWAAGHLQESQQQQQQQLQSAGLGQPPTSSHLPSHLQNSQLPSPLPRDTLIHQQHPPSAHQDTPSKPLPSGHNQAVLRNDRPGKGVKHGGLEINPEMASKIAAEAQKHHQGSFGFPPHVPPAHSGQRPYLLPPEQQGMVPGHHPMHYPPGFKPGVEGRGTKSPSIQTQPPHKLGTEVRTRTPPVTSGAMLYAGVVSGQPRSLSPTSASPEGQVIERLPNPLRQGEPGQSPSPLSLRLPGSHLQDAPPRFMKDDGHDGPTPPAAHGERAPSREREMAMIQHMMEQQRLQQHLFLAQEAARSVALENAARSAAQEAAARNSAAGQDPGRGAEVARSMPGVVRGPHELTRNTPSTHETGRKGSISSSQPGSLSQPLNLSPSDSRSGHSDPSRGTPKSTPPAPQSPFPMSFLDRKADSSRLPSNVASAFMQPSPGGHREGLPPHMYPPELSLASIAAHNPFGMVGRLPIDPRIYGPGQQPPPHLMREGVHPGHFPQPFPGGARFPGLDQHPDGSKKGEGGHPDQPTSCGMLRSPSPTATMSRQLQAADLMRQPLIRMPHELPTRESPVGILQRYPVMWQGALALKNDNSYVQMHFIAGNRRLPNQALPQPMQNGALPPLRISQRMRLEQMQLEGVAKRMQCEDDYCILIAVACGRDQNDINHQTRALSEGFISYLLNKQAAGIVNVPLPGSEQAGFVVHIFPPCEFVDTSVAQQGSVALMEQLREVPHAVIIIATT